MSDQKIYIHVPEMKYFNQEHILFEELDDIAPIKIILPNRPLVRSVSNANRPVANQKWERTQLPKSFLRFRGMNKEDIYSKLTPEEHKFILREYDRIENGYWFYNNGELLWISGTNYMYLNYWKIDSGYPDFRMCDVEYFWHWWQIVNDPDCAGMIDLERRRSGKCFSINTPIRMYDGNIKMVQDIKEGELVMGDDSTPRKVHGTTSGSEEMFNIIPNKGDGFTCNGSHVLTLFHNKQCANDKRGFKKKSIVNISVKDYINLTESEKSNLVLFRKGWGKNYKENTHYIPPYILGLYLGDGTRNCGHITKPDIEVFDSLKEFCDNNNLQVVKSGSLNRINRREEDGSSSLHLTINGEKKFFKSIKDVNKYFGWNGKDVRKHSRKWFKDKYNPQYTYNSKTNPYREELKRLGVFSEKNIPNDYLIDSEFNRLQLLAGLLDTDGHLSVKKKTSCITSYAYEIIQKDKILSYQIVELARSLGFYVHIKPKQASLKRKDKPDYFCTVYRISIGGDINRIPCRIKRKQVPKDYIPRVNSLNTGIKVESAGIGEYYGFAVDGNNLFLLEDGTVVHNSFRCGCIAYTETFTYKDVLTGIQSKTDDDGNKFFQKTIVKPWKRLPFYLQPEFDSSNNPRHDLRFYTPSTRGASAREGLISDEALQSNIEVRSSLEIAFDGEKLHRSVDDESAKMADIDIVERWMNVKRLCVQVDNRIVGKGIVTSSVGEMVHGGGQRFKTLWDYSDHSKKTDGRTASWMEQHYIPAFEGYVIDEFGRTLKEKGLELLNRNLQRLKGKPHELSAEKRQFPRNLKEAFRISTGECRFNVEVIDAVLEKYTFDNPNVSYGNFKWKDNKQDTEVVFIPTDKKNGRFIVSYLFEDQKMSNKKIMQNGSWFPGNFNWGVGGADPFRTDVITSNKKSNGTGAWFREHDPIIDFEGKDVSQWKTNCFIATYCNRPLRDEYCEDMLMACIYYGIPMFPEMNLSVIDDYFKARGYTGFLLYPKDTNFRISKTPGANTNTKSIPIMFSEMDNFIDHHGLYTAHPEVMEACRDADPTNLQPADLFVAACYALTGSRSKKMSYSKKNTKSIENKLFDTFDL